ncbi:MAG: HDOD domain-containing protein [Phycisphaerales bacterium]|nr:MAG: HDOD domain-containing protein [Phycisphaerales bacterium]
MASSPDTATSDFGTDRQRVEIILAQIEELPTLPAVALRLLELTTASDTSARDIVEVIETDQALTAKILSLVRRADLGVRDDVMTIERAVVLMGFEAVRSAVLSVQIYETFASVEPHDETDFNRAEFWKHSLAVACAAQLIAERLDDGGRPAEAFVCGLLHDVGKMALDACLPKSYARVVRRAQRGHQCISDVEHEILGIDHTITGKRLLTRWRLPKAIAECAWLHHQPPDALPKSIEAAAMVMIVHLADNLVRRQRIGFSGYNRVDPVDELADRIGLPGKALDHVIARLPETIEQHCQLVGLDRLTSTDLYAEALADANEELGRLNQSLAETNRRLAWRSRYFDALRAFHAGLTLDDRVGDVCRSAARATANLFGTEQAVGFGITEAEVTFHVAGESDEAGPAMRLPPLSVERGSARAAVNSASCIMPAMEYWPAVADHVGHLFQGEAVSMLPFVHSNAIVGGVLFTTAHDQIARHNQARAELESLCAAFGLAAATAIVRCDGQRLQEELAEVNRRLHGAQAQLLRARSLAMIARMAAGAAHELNNPLAIISGRAQMLARTAATGQERRALEIISEQCDRATQIVSELMEFAKPYTPHPTEVQLGSWAASLRDRWLDRSSLDADEFVVTISDPAVTLYVDTRQLSEIFDAILMNAMEAVAGSVARLVVNSTSTASDDTVVIAVQDSGKGMSPDVLEHALDPFFSHRAAGRGRGLGLSRAARLAENNGGRLWLDSTEGVGTTVYVELPAGRRA